MLRLHPRTAGRTARGSSALVGLAALLVAVGAGPALAAPASTTAAPSTVSRAATVAAVDVTSRASALAFWRSDYTGSPDPGWTGSTAGCNPGTTTAAFKDSVSKRINYFRQMAGVPTTTIDPTDSARAQKAALLMAANGTVSHSPPSSWACYTSDGADAAAHSLLSMGATGAGSISQYMSDPGDGNYAAGHRRWVLYPQSQTFGTGDVSTSPGYNALTAPDGHYFDPRPATRDAYVAWPPPGYVPVGVVYRKWSLSLAGADFTNAAVSMTKNGAPYAVTRQAPYNGYGENTLVWSIPDASDSGTLPAGVPDTTFTVNVTGVAGSSSTSYSYTVKAFDPDLATGQPDLVVDSVATSPAAPVAGQAVTLSATVRNAGTVGIPAGTSWSTAFSVDNTAVGTSTSASLGAGASTVVTSSGTWTATAGDHTVQATADSGGSVPESAESNNSGSTPLTVAPPATVYQEGKLALGGWRPVSDPTARGGTFAGSTTAQDVATIAFSGSAVSWLTRGGPTLGKAAVLIDGKQRATVDLYRTAYGPLTFSYSGLGARAHTFSVRVLGTRNASSGGVGVALDGVKVGSAVTAETAPKWTFSGWKTGSATAASGGSYRTASSAGAVASWTFTGTGFEWLTSRGPAYGQAELIVDGQVVSSGDLYAPTLQWQQKVFDYGLTAGPHTVTIRVLGTRNASSTGTAVVLDALRFYS